MLPHSSNCKMESISKTMLPETFTEPVTPSSSISELEEGEIDDDEDVFDANSNGRQAQIQTKVQGGIANRENCVPKTRSESYSHASRRRRESSSSRLNSERNLPPHSKPRWNPVPIHKSKSRQLSPSSKSGAPTNRDRKPSNKSSPNSRPRSRRSGSLPSSKKSTSHRKSKTPVKDASRTLSSENRTRYQRLRLNTGELDKISSPESVVLVEAGQNAAHASASTISLSSSVSSPGFEALGLGALENDNEEELQLKLAALQSLVGSQKMEEEEGETKDVDESELGEHLPGDEEELDEDLLRAQLLVAMTSRKRQEIDYAFVLDSEQNPTRSRSSQSRSQSPSHRFGMTSPVSVASSPSFFPEVRSIPAPPPSFLPFPYPLPPVQHPYGSFQPTSSPFPDFGTLVPPLNHFPMFQPTFVPLRPEGQPHLKPTLFHPQPIRSNLVSVPLLNNSRQMQQTELTPASLVEEKVSSLVEKCLLPEAVPPSSFPVPIPKPQTKKFSSKPLPQALFKLGKKVSTQTTPTTTVNAVTKGTLMTTIPKPTPLIISFNGDTTDEDEDEIETGKGFSTPPTATVSSTDTDLDSLVEQYLKGTREKMELTKQKQVKVPDTPQALRHLSESQQEEYRRLKREIERRERQQQKPKRSNNNNESLAQQVTKPIILSLKEAPHLPVSAVRVVTAPPISLTTNSLTVIPPLPLATVRTTSMAPPLPTVPMPVAPLPPLPPSTSPISLCPPPPLPTTPMPIVPPPPPFPPVNPTPAVTSPIKSFVLETQIMEEQLQKREEFEKQVEIAENKVYEWIKAQEEWKDAMDEIRKLRQAMLRAQTRKETLQGTLDSLSTDLQGLLVSLPKLSPNDPNVALTDVVSKIKAALSPSSTLETDLDTKTKTNAPPTKPDPSLSKNNVTPPIPQKLEPFSSPSVNKTNETTPEIGQKAPETPKRRAKIGNPGFRNDRIQRPTHVENSTVTQVPKLIVAKPDSFNVTSPTPVILLSASKSNRKQARRKKSSTNWNSNPGIPISLASKRQLTRILEWNNLDVMPPRKLARLLAIPDTSDRPSSILPRKIPKPILPEEHWKGETVLGCRQPDQAYCEVLDLSKDYVSPVSWKLMEKNVDIAKPLCPFFLMGKCLDTRCRYQHLKENHS